jgi:deoxyribose-phosphate aldolase
MDEAIVQRITEMLQAIPGLPSGQRIAGLGRPTPHAQTPLSRYIDHTLLKPEATAAQIERLCAEAVEHDFASVCVNPTFVSQAVQALRGSEVAVCTVIGFPLGATTTKVKVFEAHQAAGHGATELDMVLAVGRLKAGEYVAVAEDIAQVAEACHGQRAICKVIIETALLTDEEKIAACLLAVRAGADFVKTSTGFSGGGATVADVALMRRVVGPELGVKASGGVRNRRDAEALIAAGATRLGASAGVAIVSEGAATGEGY